MAHTNCTFQPARYERILRANVSQHATKRHQQRGINSDQITLILAFGAREYDGRGAVRHLMTEGAMKRLCATIGKSAQIYSLAGMYAIVSASDDTVITVGHRY
jgi:hypothetical protein